MNITSPLHMGCSMVNLYELETKRRVEKALADFYCHFLWDGKDFIDETLGLRLMDTINDVAHDLFARLPVDSEPVLRTISRASAICMDKARSLVDAVIRGDDQSLIWQADLLDDIAEWLDESGVTRSSQLALADVCHLKLRFGAAADLYHAYLKGVFFPGEDPPFLALADYHRSAGRFEEACLLYRTFIEGLLQCHH